MSDRIRFSMIDKAGGRLNLTGIPEDAFEKIEGVLNGHQWMVVEDGQPRFSPARKALPDPRIDDELLPYWQHDTQRQYCLQGLVFDPEDRGYQSPSFMVSHICGYYYTPENYRQQADLLESYGFVCMRSKRGDSGRFWETWYLPGAWTAKGDLKEAIATAKPHTTADNFSDRSKREIDAVVAFLCKHASFGSLDVVIQRAAMAMED